MGRPGAALSVAAIALAAMSVLAQTPEQKPSFEVASIKENRTSRGIAGGCRGNDTKMATNDLRRSVPLGRCSIQRARLGHLIGIAYGMSTEQLVSDIDWTTKGIERFDVEAKAESPSTTTEAQVLAMLSTLLENRFKLKFHIESKEVDKNALVIAKNGLKLQVAKEEEDSKSMWGGPMSLRLPETWSTAKSRQSPVNILVGQKLPMSEIANLISAIIINFGSDRGGEVVRERVTDETGLEGLYNFRLEWEPDMTFNQVLQDRP